MCSLIRALKRQLISALPAVTWRGWTGAEGSSSQRGLSHWWYLVPLLGSSPPRPFWRWLGFPHRIVVEFQSGSCQFLSLYGDTGLVLIFAVLFWLSRPTVQIPREEIELSHFFGRCLISGLYSTYQSSGLKLHICYHKWDINCHTWKWLVN